MDSLPPPTSASSSVEAHRERAPRTVSCAVLTVSDTRTPNDDKSGALIRDILIRFGHEVVAYQIVKDESDQIGRALDEWLADEQIRVIIINGGTGITGRDVTFPTITSRIEKELPGFGEIFRMLSWHEVGSAAILSRATAGVANNTVIYSIPGSPNAVRLAMERIIAPELGHIVSHATS